MPSPSPRLQTFGGMLVPACPFSLDSFDFFTELPIKSLTETPIFLAIARICSRGLLTSKIWCSLISFSMSD
jgi:hypothetical protein